MMYLELCNTINSIETLSLLHFIFLYSQTIFGGGGKEKKLMMKLILLWLLECW